MQLETLNIIGETVMSYHLKIGICRLGKREVVSYLIHSESFTCRPYVPQSAHVVYHKSLMDTDFRIWTW